MIINVVLTSCPNDEFALSILSERWICALYLVRTIDLYCFLFRTVALTVILLYLDYEFRNFVLSRLWLLRCCLVWKMTYSVNLSELWPRSVVRYTTVHSCLVLSGLWLCVVSSKSFCQQLIVNLFPGNTNLIFTISSYGMTFKMLQTLPKLKPLTKGCLNIEDKTICNISNDVLKNRHHSLHLPRYYGISEMTSVHQYVEEL